MAGGESEITIEKRVQSKIRDAINRIKDLVLGIFKFCFSCFLSNSVNIVNVELPNEASDELGNR
jgi:hypothetical protein